MKRKYPCFLRGITWLSCEGTEKAFDVYYEGYHKICWFSWSYHDQPSVKGFLKKRLE